MADEMQSLARRLIGPLMPWIADRIPILAGTWSPTYVGLTTAGVTTYVEQSGNYTRVGRVVFAQGRVRWSAASGTGDAVISLPFAAGAYTYNPITIYTENLTFGALPPYGLLQPSTNLFRLFTPVNNGVSAPIAVEAAGEISFMATYFI